ncbi:MAG TPA: sigma-54 dependent transcriptional regulator [Labilithrix sp.]|jgi:two-component system response regulator HydG|nr:sigma-54 dependent transcriptional regulator [Labilithrix sp.]
MVAKRHRVLIVDDDAAMVSTLADGLEDRGYEVARASKSDEIEELVRDLSVEVLITDLRMPAMDGIALLDLSRRIAPERPVIVMTAFGAVDTAVQSLQKGAYHYLLKPFKVAELEIFVRRALEERALRTEATSLRRALGDRYSMDEVVARSGAMLEVRDLVDRVADADVPVVLYGETGTGKGLIARVLHARGRRASAPFVPVNCAAIPENLLESELFGVVKGAFTGATTTRHGLFVEADGGTLFLDEVGDMAPALQGKLLDVLERQTVRAVGASRERSVNVRIVAATHRDLRARTAAGLFREDLLYRLEGVAIEIPPLRQRREDIPVLLGRFLADARDQNPRSVVERFAPDAIKLMMTYSWPGNVRELEHAVTRAVLLGKTAEAQLTDLPPAIVNPPASERPIDFGEEVIPVRELQRKYAVWALERLGGRKMLACEKLGIDTKTLNKWLSLVSEREG